MVGKKHKSLLAMALASALGAGAMLPTTSSAVNIADDEIGEVALFPYYAARGSWQTFIRLVNTSDHTLLLKVRFREAQQSNDVLDFVLALSPHDVWSGWTSATAYTDNNGNVLPGVVTTDRSCITTSRNQFNPVDEEVGSDPTDPTTFGKVIRKRIPFSTALGGDPQEGHIEVISLGHIPASLSGVSDFWNDWEHDDFGFPENCSSINTFRAGNTSQIRAAGAQFFEPINALFANSYLFNSPTGQGAGVKPTMLANFFNPGWLVVPGTGCFPDQNVQLQTDQAGLPISSAYMDAVSNANLICQLGSNARQSQPDLNSAYPAISTVRSDSPGSAGFNGVVNGALSLPGTGYAPRIIMDEWDRGVDAVSAVLARASVINEWAARRTPASPITAFQTEWVVTFPTRHWYTNPPDASGTPQPLGNPIAPFSGDEEYEFTLYDREEGFNRFLSPDIGPCGSPDTVGGEGCNFANEVNVITFGQTINGVPNPDLPARLGSQVAVDIPFENLPLPRSTIPGTTPPIPNFAGYGKLVFESDNAVQGLGSDERANQIYDNGTQRQVWDYGETGTGSNVGPVAPAQTTVTINGGQTVNAYPAGHPCALPFPPGFSYANPPQPADFAGNGIIGTGTGVLIGGPQGPVAATTAYPGDLPIPTLQFQNTLFLESVQAAPYVATLGTPSLTQSVAGVCDDPATPANDAVNAVTFPGLQTFVAYRGLPVIGFQLSLYEALAGPANSYAAAQEHGYQRTLTDLTVDAITGVSGTTLDNGPQSDLFLCAASYINTGFPALFPPLAPVPTPGSFWIANGPPCGIGINVCKPLPDLALLAASGGTVCAYDVPPLVDDHPLFPSLENGF